MSKKHILFGKPGKQYDIHNLIILIVKQYIYKQRVKCDQLLFESAKRNIVNYYNMEKYTSIVIGKQTAFLHKWRLFQNLIDQ